MGFFGGFSGNRLGNITPSGHTHSGQTLFSYPNTNRRSNQRMTSKWWAIVARETQPSKAFGLVGLCFTRPCEVIIGLWPSRTCTNMMLSSALINNPGVSTEDFPGDSPGVLLGFFSALRRNLVATNISRNLKFMYNLEVISYERLSASSNCA